MAVRNVVSYGAVGDGTTDDTVAVQAAAAACANGDSLYFPGTNTYLIDYFVIPSSNVTVTGDSAGSRATVKKRTASGTNIAFMASLDQDNITVQNLILNGQGPSQSWWDPNPYTADFVVFADNIQFKGGGGHAIIDVYSHHAGSAGARVYGCDGVTMTRLVGDNNGFGTVACYARTYQTLPRFRNIVITASSADLDYCDGFRFYEGDIILVDSCVATNARNIPAAPAQFAGIYFDAVTLLTASNNTISGNSARGVDSGPGSNDCTIFGNQIFNHPQDGILPGNSGFVIQKNYIYNNTSTGIAMKGGSHFIKDNACHGHNYGIGTTGDTPSIALINNDCRNNSSGSVSPGLRACTGFSETGTIEDNDIFAGISSNNNGCAIAATF